MGMGGVRFSWEAWGIWRGAGFDSRGLLKAESTGYLNGCSYPKEAYTSFCSRRMKANHHDYYVFLLVSDFNGSSKSVHVAHLDYRQKFESAISDRNKTGCWHCSYSI